MNAPTLEVLNIQVEQIERQVQEIRRHLETHQFAAQSDTRAHLEHAVANCFGIETLAAHVHACVTCADKARNNRLALPVCAGDSIPADPAAYDDTKTGTLKSEQRRLEDALDGEFPYGRGGAA